MDPFSEDDKPRVPFRRSEVARWTRIISDELTRYHTGGTANGALRKMLTMRGVLDGTGPDSTTARSQWSRKIMKTAQCYKSHTWTPKGSALEAWWYVLASLFGLRAKGCVRMAAPL